MLTGRSGTRPRYGDTENHDDAIEKVGDALNIVERTVQGGLERSREFIESRGTETGQWRGEVKPTGEVRGDTPP